MVVIREGEPRDAMRFILGLAGKGRILGAQHLSGLEHEGLPIFLTTLDPLGAQWMQQWLTTPYDSRVLVIWDTRLNRCVELKGTIIERHSPGNTPDGRTDRYTLRASSLKEIPRPSWLLRVSDEPKPAT